MAEYQTLSSTSMNDTTISYITYPVKIMSYLPSLLKKLNSLFILLFTCCLIKPHYLNADAQAPATYNQPHLISPLTF